MEITCYPDKCNKLLTILKFVISIFNFQINLLFIGISFLSSSEIHFKLSQKLVSHPLALGYKFQDPLDIEFIIHGRQILYPLGD